MSPTHCEERTNPILINESGLYSLVLSSKLPQARVFKRWVTSEVLPQIRRTGGYIPTTDGAGQRLSDEQIVERAFSILGRTLGMNEKFASMPVLRHGSLYPCDK